MTRYYFIAYMYHIFFIQQSSASHWSCSQIIALMNSVAIHTGGQMYVCHSDHIYFGYTPYRGITESYGRSIFKLFQQIYLHYVKMVTSLNTLF
jgi:hypothetical protein